MPTQIKPLIAPKTSFKEIEVLIPNNFQRNKVGSEKLMKSISSKKSNNSSEKIDKTEIK